MLSRGEDVKFLPGDFVKIDGERYKYVVTEILPESLDYPYLRAKVVSVSDFFHVYPYYHNNYYYYKLNRLEFYYSKDRKTYLKMIESIKSGKMTKIKDFTGKMIDSNEAIKTMDGLVCNINETVEVEGGGRLHKNSELLKICEYNKRYNNKTIYMHRDRSYPIKSIVSIKSGVLTTENLYVTNNAKQQCCIAYCANNGTHRVIQSPAELVELGMIEHMNDGVFYTKDSIKNAPAKQLKYREFKWIKKESSNLKDNIKFGIISPTYRAFAGHKYTFGIELECSKLYMPDYLQKDLNILCVRDGSINNELGEDRGGPEIVTGVLTGDAGLQQLQTICNEVSKRGEINKSCGEMYATL